MDGKVIALSYIKSRFILDVIATIPYDLIIDNRGGSKYSFQFRLFAMLKMVRLIRFTKVIAFLNTSESVKLSLKLFKLIFYLLVYIHLQACAWFYYTKWDRTWYPIPDLIKEEYHFYDHGFAYTYCLSVWHSVSILDGADMVPVTSHQAIVVSCLVFVSEFIHAHILGTIGVVLHALNRKSAKFQEQIEFVTATMKNIKLHEDSQHQILDYLTKRQNDMDAQQELQSLMSLICPSLRQQVTQHLFLSAIKNISVFNENQDVIEFIVLNIEANQYMPEDVIIKQGQKATHLYILAQGQCEVLVKDQYKKDEFVRDIQPGSLFGEVALLYGTKRTATVRSRDQCTIGALSEEDFNELIAIYPEIEKILMVEARQYFDFLIAEINLNLRFIVQGSLETLSD